VIDITGAPEEIRTPDPQIRSLRSATESLRIFCKPTPKPAPDNQSVSPCFANQKPRTKLTAERLREVLSYDPETGEFRWIIAPSSYRVQVGQIAGGLSRGYRLIRIDGTKYRANRLAFLFMTGMFPDHDVDHADRNPSNDAWSNLREATKSENRANSKRPSTNTSGYKGVYWRKARRKWTAIVQFNRRRVCVGSFNTPEAAHAAYVAAAIKHCGEFAYSGEGDRNVAPAA
jgi:hypothetical protein